MSKLAFLFPGQGSQYVGMGKGFWHEFAIAKHLFEEANETLGFDLKQMCFNGSSMELTQTLNAQPAILTVSVIAFRVYMQEVGIEPAYAAGHSLGEYSALVCSGQLAFADALRLVRLRGELMQAAADSETGAMAAVIGESREALEALCEQISTTKQPVVIACYNSQQQNVISGQRSAVYKVVEQLQKRKIKSVFLKVSAPFHCPLMLEAANELFNELSKFKYNAWRWPVISNVTALPYGHHDSLAELLRQQMIAPVRWVDTLFFLQEQGIGNFVELGPKKVVSELVKESIASAHVYSLTGPDLLPDIARCFGDKAGRFRKGLEWMEACWNLAVTSRNQNWNLEEYMRDVVGNCNRMKDIIQGIKNAEASPTSDQAHTMQELLVTVLKAKKLSQEEQDRIMKKID
ncbi:ACP S-malonyltransferase [Paenibacillus elgii]